MKTVKLFLCLMLCIFLHACSSSPTKTTDSGPDSPIDSSSIPDAVPKAEPKSRYGNPKSYVVFGQRYHVMESSVGYVEKGEASWYGKKFHGRRTSNGETYDMYAMTAAHKKLPLPTYVEVTNLANNKKVIVKVNDRGPFHGDRIIDLSYAAADKLGFAKQGTAMVQVRALNPGNSSRVADTPEVKTLPQAPVIEAEPLPAPTTPPVTTTPVNLPEATPSTTGGLFVQVGAFSELKNAEKLRGNLQSLAGDKVKITPSNINGRNLYRVRIGPYNNMGEVDSVTSQLGSYEVYNHKIVYE